MVLNKNEKIVFMLNLKYLKKYEIIIPKCSVTYLKIFYSQKAKIFIVERAYILNLYLDFLRINAF